MHEKYQGIALMTTEQSAVSAVFPSAAEEVFAAMVCHYVVPLGKGGQITKDLSAHALQMTGQAEAPPKS